MSADHSNLIAELRGGDSPRGGHVKMGGVGNVCVCCLGTWPCSGERAARALEQSCTGAADSPTESALLGQEHLAAEDDDETDGRGVGRAGRRGGFSRVRLGGQRQERGTPGESTEQGVREDQDGSSPVVVETGERLSPATHSPAEVARICYWCDIPNTPCPFHKSASTSPPAEPARTKFPCCDHCTHPGACGMGLQVSESALGAAVRDAFLAQHEGHSPAPQETPKETQQ